jgi:hypothetical protein
MTLTKKLTLLVSTALVALAFAIPSSASAYSSWTLAGGEIPSGFVVTEHFQGNFAWTRPWIWSYGQLSCPATIAIRVENVKGTQKARISEFNRDLNNCTRTGDYGDCEFKSSASNFPSGWSLAMGSTIGVTSPEGVVEIHDTYTQEKACRVYEDHPRWQNSGLQVIPTQNAKNKITKIMLEGTTEQGIVYTFGPFTAVNPFEEGLGLK